LKATLLALPLALAACAETPARYVVGEPYRMGGVWSYPREDFALVETGLATRHPGPGAFARTANGEAWTGAVAAHRTLQLPAVVSVTNLENGRSMLLRVNERGPVHPGRVIGLSDRAAELLGIPPGGAAQVRVAVDGERSRLLAEAAPGRPALAIATAPRAAVAAESLAPPPGARAAAAPPPRAAEAAATPEAAAVPALRLPETVTTGPASPGRLWIEAGTLSGADAAGRLAARLPGARVEASGPRRAQQFRVLLGPFASVAAADAALERTLAAGVSGARILVD
jgi:rare lipoprotein A